MVGKLIVFEGIDGSGKSTQVDLVAKQLPAIKARTLSNTVLGKEVEDLVKGIRQFPEVEALLFAAARLNTYREYTTNLLESGSHIVYDRYLMDAFAYSCNSRIGVDEKYVSVINIHIPNPDITFLLDIDPETALERLDRPIDHYEKVDFLRCVREEYLRCSAYPSQYFKDQNWVILDGSKPINVIQSLVWEEVQKIL